MAEQRRQMIEERARLAAEAEAAGDAPKPETANGDNTATPSAENPATAGPVAVAGEEATLSNDLLKLTLSNKGAGIQTAQLLKYNRTLGSEGNYVTLNETRPNPIGSFSSEPNKFDESLWKIKEKTATSVTFEADTPDKLHIEKTFRIPEDRPYEVDMDISIRNDSGALVELDNTQTKYIYAGGAAPLHFDEWSMQIGMFYREDQSTFVAKNVDYFGGRKKVLGVFGRSEKPYIVLPSEDEKADNLAFAGVNDQFFTILIQAEEPQDGRIWSDKYNVVINGDREESERKRMRGCELAMGLPNIALNPGDKQTLSYDIFIGPKESQILKQSDEGWKMAMNYDQIPIFGKLFGWAIKPLALALSASMIWLHDHVGNYGIAIILLTIIVRLLMWPVYAKSSRSMKRMSKLSPIMKEIKEKYPDDPQRVNQETMKLYSEYGINPMGGCLPMFLQLPVFLGFYRMLWGAVELRHESFLFANDLTMPDQFAMIGGFPIHLFPILMALASLVQMWMTPKTGDNTQRIIFMMMPFMFLVFCYNFASGLALYWTVSNVFTVVQTWIMNKLPEPELTKSDKPKKGKPGFMTKLQDKLEAAQAQQLENSGKKPAKKASSSKKNEPKTPAPGQSRTKLASEKGSRHTKPKKKRKR